MRSADKVRLRLRSLFLRPRVEAELAAELSFHLEQQTAENIAAGMEAKEARRAALRLFGGFTQIQERCREMRGTRFIDELVQDLSYAVRTLRGSPAFTIVAALSLALGIGANTAIFSLINALILRPLAVQAPDRLVALGDTSHTGSLSEGSVRTDIFSYPMYEQLRDHNQSFTGLLASGRSGRLRVGTGGGAAAEPARGRIVSGNYFAVLGVRAVRGRTFTAAEDRAPGGDPVVVISHDYWQRRFAGDDGVIGRVLALNGYPFTVVGVAQPGFAGDVVGAPTEIWIPLMMQSQVNPGRKYLDRWDTSWLLFLGRLKPGASLARAQAEANALFKRSLTTYAGAAIPPQIMPGPDVKPIEASPGGAGFSSLRRQFSQPLLTLMAIVGLVLVVACANLANLLLERAVVRQKEIAVRLALGAGRPRLIRQLLTESLLLAVLGGVLGILFALWAGPALLRLTGGSSSVMPLDLRPDLPVLGFTTVLALLTGIAFGLAPARRATRVELAPTLKENARTVAGSGGTGRWPVAKLLVVCQFALSLLLLTGAGLFVRTLQNLERLNLGYDRERLVLLKVDPVAAGYTEGRLDAFPLQFLDRIKAVPGASAVTYSENGIFSGTESADGVSLEGTPRVERGIAIASDRVGPDYFQSVGVPLLAGREIGPRDRKGTTLVAVINEALAKRYFAGRSPLGKHLTIVGPPEDTVFEIVGVARDVRDHDLRGPVPPRFYTALAQSTSFASAFNVEIRTANPGALVKPLREAVRGYDPNLPVEELRPLSAMISESINHESLITKLSAVFGVLALLLASIGLYGVVSYTVARRANEIGIRMALGASRESVLWMVLRETLFLALAGVAIGVPAALAAARLVASRLVGLSAHDPATLAAATAVLLAVAVFAGAIPGSRATRVDPTQALRYG